MTDIVKILAVDDLEESLVTLEELLRRDDVQVLTARSGADALALLAENDVAVALVDVVLPEMDGFELAERMRSDRRTPSVPIIFVTGAPSDARRMFRGYDLGAVDFLHKPIDGRVVAHKVDVFIELYRQRRTLADTVRLSEELLSIVSHDLRNPLNAILMSADLLERRRAEEDVLKAAARIRRSGTRMTRMLDDLLDLTRARIGSGIPIERKKVDLEKIARKVGEELDAAAPPRIRLSIEGDLELDGDPARLEQVVANLVSNAIRHGTPGGPVEVSLTGDGAALRLRVQNAGAIPAAILPTVFQPFRARTARTARAEGLGLGLFLASEIVRSHGGTIRATASEAAGTVVDVELPRAASSR